MGQQTHQFSPDSTDATLESVVIVGHAGGWLASWVAQQFAASGVEADAVADAPTAVSCVVDQEGPVLVVLVQERPGDLPEALPQQLRDAQEGTRILSIAGSWCEGETRTAPPWPAVERVYWHQLPAWLAGEYESNGLGLAASRPSAAPIHGAIAVDAADYETASALSDALVDAGFAAVWAPRCGPRPLLSGAACGVWVGGQLCGLNASRLDAFCRQMRLRQSPVVAILDYPRPDEWRLAERLGVACVMGKPWSADSLVRVLAGLLSRDDSSEKGLPQLRAA